MSATQGPGERLQKVLARAGFASRRRVEELIADGRIEVNGERAELGRRVDPERDRVTVDGIPVVLRTDLEHHLLNKPVGVVSTADDPQGRPTVVQLVPSAARLFPVGRLDVDSEGLLVVTNDGDLTQRLTHPSHGVEKEYLAEVEGIPGRATLRQLREGVPLDDGPTAPARVRLVQERDDSAAVEIVIHEGRNRQVRRMFESVGHPVRRLVRTRIGPLADRDLAPGASRRLTPAEVRALYEATTQGPSGPAAKPPEAGSEPGPDADGKYPRTP